MNEPTDQEPVAEPLLPPEAIPDNFRSGFVAVIGVPNAGKSTLINKLVGQKISIATRCAQTTRHRICGIWSEKGSQVVLVDTPGVIESPNRFNVALVEVAEAALEGCDLVIHLRDPELANSDNERRVIELLRNVRAPVWQVWNKIDRKLKKALPTPIDELEYEQTFFVSAKDGRRLDVLKDALVEKMPLGHPYYPLDDLSDRDLRFMAAELVREKLFIHLHQEIPYGVATWVETWEERPDGLAFVRVTILTERKNHKGIIIGNGGQMLKKIGRDARKELEELLEQKVFLEIWVQVRPNWRKNPVELKRLGMKI